MTPICSTILKPSGLGWRVTVYDAKGEPLASFWALTSEEAWRRLNKHRIAT